MIAFFKPKSEVKSKLEVFLESPQIQNESSQGKIKLEDENRKKVETPKLKVRVRKRKSKMNAKKSKSSLRRKSKYSSLNKNKKVKSRRVKINNEPLGEERTNKFKIVEAKKGSLRVRRSRKNQTSKIEKASKKKKEKLSGFPVLDLIKKMSGQNSVKE